MKGVPSNESACPLCGTRFDENESRGGCAACGKKGCGLVRCPNCGYEFPPDSTTRPSSSGWLKKLFGKERS